MYVTFRRSVVNICFGICLWTDGTIPHVLACLLNKRTLCTVTRLYSRCICLRERNLFILRGSVCVCIGVVNINLSVWLLVVKRERYPVKWKYICACICSCVITERKTVYAVKIISFDLLCAFPVTFISKLILYSFVYLLVF